MIGQHSEMTKGKGYRRFRQLLQHRYKKKNLSPVRSIGKGGISYVPLLYNIVEKKGNRKHLWHSFLFGMGRREQFEIVLQSDYGMEHSMGVPGHSAGFTLPVLPGHRNPQPGSHCRRARRPPGRGGCAWYRLQRRLPRQRASGAPGCHR